MGPRWQHAFFANSSIPALAMAILSIATLALAGCDASALAEFRANFRAALGTATEGQTCGDRSEFAALVQDCPMEGVCFTSACQAHDQCYAQCQVSRAECDRQFRLAMSDVCTSSFELADLNFRECLYFAHLYWTVVQLEGAEFYVCDNQPPPGPQPGACCHASGADGCEDVASEPECPFTDLFVAGLTCDEVEAQLGGCPAPPNDDCENAVRVCEGQSAGVGLGSCDDEADSGRICSVSSQDCVLGEACLPHEGDAFRCIVAGDNRLATSDGPQVGDACGADQPNALQADVWYEYVAPCTGTLSVQMCNGTFYDSVLAIYGAGDASAGCACPADNETLLICDDDGCGGFGNPSAATLPAVEGACYLIRVGGWSSSGDASGTDKGVSRLDIGVLCDDSGAN